MEQISLLQQKNCVGKLMPNKEIKIDYQSLTHNLRNREEILLT